MRTVVRRIAPAVIAVVATTASLSRGDDATATEASPSLVPVAMLPHARTWRIGRDAGEGRELLRLPRGDYTAVIGDATKAFTLEGPTSLEYHEASPLLRYGGLAAMGIGAVTAGITFWIASHECDAQTTLTPGTSIPVTRHPCDGADADAHAREKTQLTLLLVGAGGVALAIAGGFVFFAAKPWISVEPLDLRAVSRGRSRPREPAGPSLRLRFCEALLTATF